MSSLLMIPARGGSKRIKRKNIKPFLGRPIIKYPIEAAKTAACFDEIMVSTEDQEIASVARSLGAEVPFLRSKKNAGDRATTAAVIEEVLKAYQKRGRQFDWLTCLYPTAALVTARRLKQAMKLLRRTKADGVVPVVRYGHPIQRAFKVKAGYLKMIQPKNELMRTQDLEPTYHDSGQFYCLRVTSFLKQKKEFMKRVVPLEVPAIETQDIDNEVDWQLAEIKFRFLRSRLLLSDR